MRRGFMKNKMIVLGVIATLCGLVFWKYKTTVGTQIGSNPMADRNISSINLCPREIVGGDLQNAEDLFSKNGLLEVNLEYRSFKNDNETRYCYLMANGKQSPTFHVQPGDRLRIKIKNNTPLAIPASSETAFRLEIPSGRNCASAFIDDTSMNIHFHGTNTPPTCGSDEVINTVINAGDSFTYDLPIPLDEPPGAYFYHPHVHGKAQDAAWGGATGVIIIEGLQNYFPQLVGLNDRIITVRDNQGLSDEQLEKLGLKKEEDNEDEKKEVPSFEISVNYHPIPYPKYTAPKLKVAPNTNELWRVVNTSADAILDITVDYDGEDQPLTIYAIDGVPTGTYGGAKNAKPIVRKSWVLAPGNRVEFVIKTPGLHVRDAKLKTKAFDTGADIDPARALLSLEATDKTTESKLKVLPSNSKPVVHRFTGMLRKIQNILFKKTRKLYFAQKDVQDPDDATKEVTEFYITVDGKKDEAFTMKRPVDIVTHENSLEEWVIENRTEEAHVFHIHQIHFLLLERNGINVTGDDRQIYDTILVPKYDGAKDSSGKPVYPSVKVRMDFHETKPGTFVYHCHILEHEDKGMMGIIQVLPKEINTKTMNENY